MEKGSVRTVRLSDMGKKTSMPSSDLIKVGVKLIKSVIRVMRLKQRVLVII
jgi:hypothetical protein